MAAVRLTKFHFKVIAQRLNYDELHTLLYQVEGCLNSLPLLSLSSHSEDGVYYVLTLGHFLISKLLQALPQKVLTISKLPLLKLCEALPQY